MIRADSAAGEGLKREPLKVEPSMARAGWPNGFGEGRAEGAFKRFEDWRVDLVTTRPGMGPNGRSQIREPPFGECRDRRRNHSAREPTPARVDSRYAPTIGRSNQDWNTVCRHNRHALGRYAGEKGVGLKRVNPRTALESGHCIPVNLVRTQCPAGCHSAARPKTMLHLDCLEDRVT